MTYIKNAVPTPHEIIFYNVTDNYFTSIKLRTGYRARNIKNEKGESQNDSFAISEDEEDAFKVLLEAAVYDVCKTALKMTKGVTDGIFFDETITHGDPVVDIEHANGFTIVDNAAYNENTLGYVDKKAIECITYHIMRDWYQMIGLDEEYAKMNAMYNVAKAELINGLFDLRKPLIS